MLVLSRKRNERIVIGDEIEIVVVGVHGDRVKLGFDAPTNVSVHRAEVYDRIQTEMAASPENTIQDGFSEIRGASDEAAAMFYEI